MKPLNARPRQDVLRAAISRLLNRLIQEDFEIPKDVEALKVAKQRITQSKFYSPQLERFLIQPPENVPRLVTWLLHHLIALLALLENENEQLKKSSLATAELKKLRAALDDAQLIYRFYPNELRELYSRAICEALAESRPWERKTLGRAPTKEKVQRKNSKLRNDRKRARRKLEPCFTWAEDDDTGSIVKEIASAHSLPATSCLDSALRGGRVKMASPDEDSLQNLFGIHRHRGELKDLPSNGKGKNVSYDFRAVLEVFTRLLKASGRNAWPRNQKQRTATLRSLDRYLDRVIRRWSSPPLSPLIPIHQIILNPERIAANQESDLTPRQRADAKGRENAIKLKAVLRPFLA